MRNKLSKEMESYIVKIEPKPIDTVSVQVEGKKYHDGETIELESAPKEITIHRETAWYRIFATWRCGYVTITSTGTGKECYYPVFREIHSAGLTVKENSAKLPSKNPSAERLESLRKNKEFRDSIDRHGKESGESLLRDVVFQAASPGKSILGKGDISPVPGAIPVVPADPKKKSLHKYRILSFLLRIINIIPEPLHFAHVPGLPGFVKGGNFFDLPKELWFETRKLITLFLNILLVEAETIFRRLWNRCRKWRKIDDIRNVFWFTSEKAEYILQNWKDNAFFGKQVLNGCNPIMIKRYSVGKEQKIPLDTLEKVCPNIKENIMNGNIYVVDYEILDGIKEDVSPTSPSTYLAAPIMLLQQKKYDLEPIAIQLKQRPGVDNPVFTPEDKDEAWILAKMWVRNSDFYYHELVSHLLRAHLMAEVFFIASQSLADQHPLARLIRATGRYTLPINITARNTLVNKGGFFTEFTAIADGEQWEILRRASKEITYESLCLPDNLEHRDVNDLKNYYYKDDAMDIWNAIYSFVRDVVMAIYKNDGEVFKDPELNHMVDFIYNHGFLRKPGCPSQLKTREEVVKYITMIMFTCSAQHAAVNHGQYDTYAWMPNGPSAMRKPTPTTKDVTERDIMDTLPGIGVTLETMKVTKFLSQEPNDFVPLGQYPEEVVGEKYMKDAVYKFQKELKKIGEKIENRSKSPASKDFPYEYLHPARMENSIAI